MTLKARLFAMLSSNEQQIEKFLHSKSTQSTKTVDFYRTGLKQYLAFADGQWPPTADLVTGFILECQTRDITPGTVHAYYRAVRTWVNWLHKRGVIDENPIDVIDAPRQPQRQVPGAVKATDLKTLLDYMELRVTNAIRYDRLASTWPDVRDLAIISTLLDTGMRVGELQKVKIAEIDLGKKRIFIPETKTGAQRYVVFEDKCRADLKLWLDIRSELPLPEKLQAAFIAKHRGKWQGLEHSGIRYMIERRCKEADIEPFNPHALRHSFAAMVLNNGGHIEFVREQLGHNSLTTTQIYTRMDTEQMSSIQARSSPRENL